jgi:hypothetical protein
VRATYRAGQQRAGTSLCMSLDVPQVSAAASPHGLAPGTHQRAGGRQQIAERYDWDDVAARYGQICERLAAGGRLARRSRSPTNAAPCRCRQRSNLSPN